tara:strand:- start:2369 stop:2653 length:285 start_codon:yes stop_codon:yes gene_type:complete
MRKVTFDNLIFRTDDDGIARARYGFGDYQLSVIKEPEKKFYEIAIFDEQKNFVQLPGIHRQIIDEDDFVDDVIGGMTEQDVTGVMAKLTSIQGA